MGLRVYSLRPPQAICSRHGALTQHVAAPTVGTIPLGPKSPISPAVSSSILAVTPEHPRNPASSSFLSQLIPAKSRLNLSNCPSAGFQLPHSSVFWYILECLQPELYFFAVSLFLFPS